MSASWRPRPTPSSKRTANSIASIRLKYAELSGGREPGVIVAAMPGDARDRFDRLAEQVAVVEPRAAAERAHRVAQLRLHERVDDDRRPALHPVDGDVQVVLRLDARVADLDELLLRELRLERLDEARGGLARRVRDDVELDGRARDHGGQRNRVASGATRASVSRTRSFGSSSIWRPRRPALTKIVSCSSAEASTCVGSRAPLAERADPAADVAGRPLRLRLVRHLRALAERLQVELRPRPGRRRPRARRRSRRRAS